MKKSYVIYFACVLGITIAGIVIAQGSPLLFWDFPSLVFTPIMAIIILLGHFSPREMLGAFRCAGRAPADEKELRKALLFFETLHRLTIISGVFAFILAIVLILSNIPSEEFKRNIGRFAAIGILTVVYALFIMMTVTVPFQSAIRKKLIG